jgi:hypothetical protein
MRQVDVEATMFAVSVATTFSSFVSIAGAILLVIAELAPDLSGIAFLMLYFWPITLLLLVAILAASFGLAFWVARIARRQLTSPSARVAGWFVRLAAALFLVPIVIVGAYAYAPALKASNPPPLTIGAYKEFDRRVEQKFPIGSLESDMAAELRRQGFVTRSAPFPNAEGMADYRDKRFPCDSYFYVRWRVGADGRLTEIKGDFRATCL